MADLTFAQLKGQVGAKLGDLELEQEAGLTDKMTREILNAYHPPQDASRRIDADLLKSGVAYAIPDEALDLLPSLVKAVIGGVIEGPLHALPELVGILYRYRKLQVELNADEAVVLRALRSARDSGEGALAPANLGKRVGEGIRLQRPMAQVLKGLKAKNTEKTILVRETNGRWVIGNV